MAGARAQQQRRRTACRVGERRVRVRVQQEAHAGCAPKLTRGVESGGAGGVDTIRVGGVFEESRGDAIVTKRNGEAERCGAGPVGRVQLHAATRAEEEETGDGAPAAAKEEGGAPEQAQHT